MRNREPFVLTASHPSSVQGGVRCALSACGALSAAISRPHRQESRSAEGPAVKRQLLYTSGEDRG